MKKNNNFFIPTVHILSNKKKYVTFGRDNHCWLFLTSGQSAPLVGGGSNNLLDELANRLSLRRKGIAGANGGAKSVDNGEAAAKQPTSALERMSSMIPGPEEEDEVDYSSKEDSNEDWD